MSDKRKLFLEQILIPFAYRRLEEVKNDPVEYRVQERKLDELRLEYKERTGYEYVNGHNHFKHTNI